MITAGDIDTLARTIYGEARGESRRGRLLVAGVIWNRWQTQYRGKKTIKDVCLDPWQFSAWNSNDPNRDRLEAITLNSQTFRECFIVALQVIDEATELPATTRHYYAMSMPAPPFWAAGADPVLIHGNHKFYEGIA